MPLTQEIIDQIASLPDGHPFNRFLDELIREVDETLEAKDSDKEAA